MGKEDPSAPVFHEDRPSVYHAVPENPYQDSNPNDNSHLQHHQHVHANGYHYSHIPLENSFEESQLQTEASCRLCFESHCDKSTGPLIAPCDCKGTMKYIHRNCLDRWRTLSPKARSFYKCDQCMRSYEFINCNKKLSSMRYLKYAFHVSLDIAVFLILWQLAVLICMGGFAIVDLLFFKGSTSKWANPLPGGVLYYLYGHGVFFFILGIFAIVACTLYLCCFASRGGRQRDPVYFGGYNPFISDWLFWWFIFSHPTYHPIAPVGPCCDCTGCIQFDCGNCGNCNVDSGNDGIGILIAILIAIVVIIIIIGVIFGFIVTLSILLGICQRHYTILKKKDEVNYYIVKDLENMSNNQVFVSGVVV